MEKLLDNSKECSEYLSKISSGDLFSFEDPIRRLTNIITKFKDVKNLEVEIRIGYISDSGFESNVSENFYQKIKSQLESSTFFKKTETHKIDEYNKENTRRSTNLLDSEKISYMKKVNLCNIDYKLEGTPFDVRVSFSKEVPLKKYSEPTIYSRNKKRTSYSYKSWNYDLTEVTYSENSLNLKNFEVEVELNKTLNSLLKSMEIHYLIHSSLLKIKDISLMCEDEDEDSCKFIFHKSKFFEE